MTKTGTQIVTTALREIRVLDPTATASGEKLTDGLDAATMMLDTWRRDRLTMGGVLISPYTLVLGTQSYTIGTGGVFNQTYPERIVEWSVVPDVTETDPLEIPMGRPANYEQWQQVRVKTQTGPRPTTLYFDDSSTAGLGRVLVHPIPSIANVGVRLYSFVPMILSLVAGTTYDLPPGSMRAFGLQLALELADRYGSGATVTPRLEKRAATAFGLFKRGNIRPKESRTRADFVIGEAVGRRTFNVYNGR